MVDLQERWFYLHASFMWRKTAHSCLPREKWCFLLARKSDNYKLQHSGLSDNVDRDHNYNNDYINNYDYDNNHNYNDNYDYNNNYDNYKNDNNDNQNSSDNNTDNNALSYR